MPRRSIHAVFVNPNHTQGKLPPLLSIPFLITFAGPKCWTFHAPICMQFMPPPVMPPPVMPSPVMPPPPMPPPMFPPPAAPYGAADYSQADYSQAGGYTAADYSQAAGYAGYGDYYDYTGAQASMQQQQQQQQLQQAAMPGICAGVSRNPLSSQQGVCHVTPTRVAKAEWCDRGGVGRLGMHRVRTSSNGDRTEGGTGNDRATWASGSCPLLLAANSPQRLGRCLEGAVVWNGLG